MRLLLIRPGALGDTLLTFPVVEALRTRYSAPHITLVGNKTVLPLAQACGLVEKIFDYEEPLWSGLFATPATRLTPATQAPPPSLASGSEWLPTEGGAARDRAGMSKQALQKILSSTDRAVAWLSDPGHIVYQNLQAAGISQVTVVPGRPSPQEHIHVTDYLARSVGVATIPQPYYGASFAALAGATSTSLHSGSPENPADMINSSLQLQEQAFAIHPGSGGARKCWPVERFASVISRLWQNGWPVLLLSGPADHARLERLLKLLPAPPLPAMLRLLVDMPLLDLAPILCQCRGYLGNDSGITHLAALLGLPTIALFGPTDPLLWQPRGRAVSIIYEPMLEQLAVEVVVERIFTLKKRQYSS